MLDVVDVADRPVGALAWRRCLGGVLGDVAGQRGVGDLPVVVLDLWAADGGDGPQVELGAPAEYERCPVGSVRGERAARAASVIGVAQRVGVEPGRWGVGGSVGAVEADDGVEVDQAAALVLGDLGVGQPGVVGEVAGA